MAQKTLAEEIITIIKAHSNDNPAPTTGTITRTYEEENYADVETEDGTHRYIPVIGENTVDTIGVIVYLDGDLNTPVLITNGGGSEIDIVTEWETTLSDTKVPSEKLTKDTLDTKISKSDTTGLVKNDGTIDTNTYATTGSLATVATTGDYDDLTDKPSIYTQNQINQLIQDIYNTLINNNYHFYDLATLGNKNNNWENYSDRITITTDNTGTLLTGKASQNGYYFVNATNKFIFTDYTCEFDILAGTGTVRWYYQNSNGDNANLYNITSNLTSADINHFKLVSSNGELKVYINDTLKTTLTQTVTGPYEVGFRIANGTDNTLKYRNFHIYTNTGA